LDTTNVPVAMMSTRHLPVSRQEGATFELVANLCSPHTTFDVICHVLMTVVFEFGLNAPRLGLVGNLGNAARYYAWPYASPNTQA
jgi:hypothetical protein